MNQSLTPTELKAVSAMIPFVVRELGTELQTRTGFTEADFAELNHALLSDVDVSKDEKNIKMIQSILNEVSNGISISDEDFLKMFSITRAEAEELLEKVSTQ